MTEQEAKELQIGDVVEHYKSGALHVIVAARYPPMSIESAVPYVKESIDKPSHWNIYSRVLSRDGKAVDKL